MSLGDSVLPGNASTRPFSFYAEWSRRRLDGLFVSWWGFYYPLGHRRSEAQDDDLEQTVDQEESCEDENSCQGDSDDWAHDVSGEGGELLRSILVLEHLDSKVNKMLV
jgi:hypothetical protein